MIIVPPANRACVRIYQVLFYTRFHQAVWFRLVLCGYFFLLFPLSKAVNSAIKK